MQSIWRGNRSLVLASTSRTRADLLASAGLSAETVGARIDERALETSAGSVAPQELAVLLAEAKAQDVAERRVDQVVIGADQVLELDGAVFHKPSGLDDARHHLQRLQGRRHALHSAVAIVYDGRIETVCDTAWLTMRPLDDKTIAAYLTLAGEAAVTASVGGYQLEGVGIHLFSRIEGDHSTILGLPLIPLLAELRDMGMLAL